MSEAARAFGANMAVAHPARRRAKSAAHGYVSIVACWRVAFINIARACRRRLKHQTARRGRPRVVGDEPRPCIARILSRPM